MTADVTVADLQHMPGALEILTRLGIDHCCGAHLTLGQAAAAAGVSLEALLEELRGLSRMSA